MAAHCAPTVEPQRHIGCLKLRMGKQYLTAFLLAGFVAISRAQSPSPSLAGSPGPNPQSAAPPVVAVPAPTPAPVLETQLVVSIPEQRLAVVVNDKVYKTYKISTSRYGEGDSLGSWRTPTGRLAVAGKIGGTVPFGGVFQRRSYTGEVLSANAPGRDPIVSRIIWLRGLDYTNRNAFHRCIYIHGTPDEDSLGRKASYGCIRMRSSDVIEVFNWINIGTGVAIVDKALGRAVKDLAGDRRLMATNMTKPEGRSDLVR
jgi:lipoprotein-anchoring transpeptidase ErfK/SrfK